MNKQEITDYFNRLASDWNKNLIHDDKKINIILDYADITNGTTVLDVACGTGVLIPDYLARNVKRITAVDISPAMIEIARAGFTDPRVELINADIETVDLHRNFDRCVVYNAFPHFFNPRELIRILAKKLFPGGRLTIAHSMSRESINKHHSGGASTVSMGLISETELAILLGEYFSVDITISNKDMYLVSGINRTAQ